MWMPNLYTSTSFSRLPKLPEPLGACWTTPEFQCSSNMHLYSFKFLNHSFHNLKLFLSNKHWCDLEFSGSLIMKLGLKSAMYFPRVSTTDDFLQTQSLPSHFTLCIYVRSDSVLTSFKKLSGIHVALLFMNFVNSAWIECVYMDTWFHVIILLDGNPHHLMQFVN